MRNALRATLLFAILWLPCAALGQSAPATLPYHTLYGRLGATPGDTGPGQAIPFATVLPNLFGTQSPNVVYAGPTSGPVALPTFRALVGADLPSPSATTLGGTQSKTCSTSNWFNTISTSGVPGCTQPNFTDLAGSIAAGQVPANLITNAMLAQAGTNTVKGNSTSGTANETDMSMPSCSAAGSTLEWTTNTGFGCVTQVASFNSRTGVVTPAAGDYTLNQIYNCTMLPQGRLTFLTGAPVQTATTSGATSHFYTPYLGQQVPIYDGTRFSCVDTGGELSQTAADTTKSPAAVANNSCYDVFVWSDSGTIRATRGPAWTNTTTRSAGTALARTKGILTNNVAITNGPGQNLGTYIGTECSNGSATFDWIFGASASGGGAASLNAWNQYNRVDVTTQVVDSGASYTFASNVTRQARASTGNQITFVSGNPEDGIYSSYDGTLGTSANSGNGGAIGIGLDITTAFSCQYAGIITVAAVAQNVGLSTSCAHAPQTGRHVISANEFSNSGVNAITFDNSSTALGPANSNTLMFKFRM